MPSPDEYSLLPGSRLSDQGSFVDNASGQLQLCLHLEDPGYTQRPLSVYDPKTHP